MPLPPRLWSALLLASRLVLGSLPEPLSDLCLVAGPPIGCYNDSLTRTFSFAASTQPGDPFHTNMTQETCGFLCYAARLPFAALEVGDQCFCTDAAGLAKAEPLRRPTAECTSPCVGNPLQTCGGAWRLLVVNYTCAPYVAGAWRDYTQPVSARVDDLISRLDAAQLIAQLTQNGADIYAPGAQLPRYIVSQECLAGFDGGDIYIAPPVAYTSSSGFPQPVNLGATWDADLVREVAAAISDEARAAFTHAGRPSLTCMSPNLNVQRDPRWGRKCVLVWAHATRCKDAVYRAPTTLLLLNLLFFVSPRAALRVLERTVHTLRRSGLLTSTASSMACRDKTVAAT